MMATRALSLAAIALACGVLLAPHPTAAGRCDPDNADARFPGEAYCVEFVDDVDTEPLLDTCAFEGPRMSAPTCPLVSFGGPSQDCTGGAGATGCAYSVNTADDATIICLQNYQIGPGLQMCFDYKISAANAYGSMGFYSAFGGTSVSTPSKYLLIDVTGNHDSVQQTQIDNPNLDPNYNQNKIPGVTFDPPIVKDSTWRSTCTTNLFEAVNSMFCGDDAHFAPQITTGWNPAWVVPDCETYINFPLTTGLAGQSNSGTYLIDNWSMTPGTPIAAPTCGPICDATGIVYIQSLGQFASTSGSGNPIATLNNVPYYAADGTGMGCASP